ncbi:1-acyl-sn-glycerol-3-phosphate acyltransferase [Amylibacter sp. SFDW26]|uniref:lysophospholipid acyltransferase family protein n=1 Tax=Amylibacter sp. SFDW26 TaxID=2652722 RepID=UPI001261FCB5|nr:lysophospholipid acyltransferase family protein [Amylibacter sp. SFDW26]KAB7610249.1 1-acyl-sn-glycerol-3-phosphate acyltransferase [Amylibacter sp. SFDW26]
MIRWDGGEPIELDRPSGLQWIRVVVRASLGVITIATLMVPMMLFRAAGAWRIGQRIVRTACWICLKIIGLPVTTKGKPMKHAGVVVANHSSWLDILTLHVCHNVFFASKDEVKSWPAIGFMARSAGTLFIKRERTDARRQHDLFLEHALKGHKLLFFPEGTSTDGLHVLPFKSSLFGAFFSPDLADRMWVQPVTALYYGPAGKRHDFYGWWGDMGLLEHMGHVLSQRKQGRLEIVFHEPLKITDYSDRKKLTQDVWQAVADGMPFRVPNDA